MVGDRIVVLDAPYALDKAGLLGQVALSLRCRPVRRTRYVEGGKQLSVHLFGYESDLMRAELLYTSLLLQATTTLARTPVPRRESPAAFRRSWLAGFTSAVARRLTAAEEKAAREADLDASAEAGRRPSVSLVLADRSTAVSSAVHAEYPTLGVGRGRTLSGSGAGSGWQAGQRADLGSPSVPRRQGSRRLPATRFSAR